LLHQGFWLTERRQDAGHLTGWRGAGCADLALDGLASARQQVPALG